MKIIPNLNLNKHPKETQTGSLIDGTNLIVSADNFIIQSEPILNITDISDKLNDIIDDNIKYNIVYCIPCNKEIIIFCSYNNSNNSLYLYRYSEIYNSIKYVTEIEYHGGNLIGEFTYNHNDLIIAISEYFEDDSKKIPLKVINLGKFEENISADSINQLNKKELHSICPEVKIPTATIKYINGNAYKGWYYIFIRYKISDSTYTQWFDLNANVFIDDYKSTSFFDYWISGELTDNTGVSGDRVPNINTDIYYTFSNELDISKISFNVEINNDTKLYSKYQLGFINVTKSSTKCYKTSDLDINIKDTVFNINNLEEYSVVNLISTYYNYYNVKSMCINKNRLYIGNYKENNNEKEIAVTCNNINLSIDYNIIPTSFFEGSNYELNTCSIFPFTYYNIFIHFVDKYGNSTLGINISNFNVSVKKEDIEILVNNIGNKLIMFNPSFDFTKNVIKGYINIDSIPDGYVGWYASYEKVETRVKYFGIVIGGYASSTYGIKVYNDRFNYDDYIDFDFDTLRLYRDINVDDKRRDAQSICSLNSLSSTDYAVTNKDLFVADSYNNIGCSTNLSITCQEIGILESKKPYIVMLYKKNSNEYYNKYNKTLIPCTSVSYSINTDNILNINNCFISTQQALIYKKDTYFNDAVKYFQTSGMTDYVVDPCHSYLFNFPMEIPAESIQINNKPTVNFFPLSGLNTTNEHEKTFAVGFIVEAKNTIDLFQQKNNTIYDSYPKTLSWYDATVNYTNDYIKTIRRSNVIQDESNEISWRKFEIDNYKIITENKGNIVKLVSIGYYFIVHTQYSMFLFNDTNAIKSNEQDIQLASIDIWDINYKEVVTSSLGFAGIQKEYNGIIGEFGYIFYDADAKRIYRYDNGKISYIDSNIIGLLYKLQDYDVHLVDDKLRNRILFRFFNNNDEDIVLSYNYNTDTFISRHSYTFYRGWSTKEITYIVDKIIDNEINNILKYNNNEYNNSNISIIINPNNYNINAIECINYNISKIDKILFNDYSPVEGTTMYYATDFIKIYSEFCNTGIIDISYTNPEDTINKVMDYTKPYWRYGNYHFNAIRNKLKEYIDGEIDATKSSRIYGNWFVIYFACNTNKQIEYKSIDIKLTNSEFV